MFTKNRSRWSLLALVVILSLGFAAMSTAAAVSAPAGTLTLHVANSAGLFTYTPVSGPVQTQSLAANKCSVTVSGSLVDMAASDRGLGLVGSSIGVRTGGATGTPCGRVDTTEDMSLTLDNVPNAASVSLDLELKGSAKLGITLLLGTSTVGQFEIRSGSSIVAGQGKDGTSTVPYSLGLDASATIGNCRNASDSGPDSGGNDNCRVTLTPAGEFDKVVFAQPLVGEFSLEGGGDAGTSDTVFNLVESFEGELGCTAGTNEATDDGGLVDAQILRYENTDGDECVLKPYNLTATTSDEDEDPSITFDVSDPADQAAVYEGYLTFNQALTTPLSAKLTYDAAAPYATFLDMLACDEAYQNLGGDNPDPAGSLNDEALPSGHTACVIEVSQSWDGTTVWHILFTADIRFK